LASAHAKPKPLNASTDSATEHEIYGPWIFSPPFLVLDRFKQTVQEAAGSLGAPEGLDPIDFWLDCLFLYLWHHGSRDAFRIRNTGPDQRQRLISDVIGASEKLSCWLAKSANNTFQLLGEWSAELPPWKRMPAPIQGTASLPERHGGELWAAQKNRQEHARAAIVQALQQLGIDQVRWPDFVQSWYANAGQQPRFRHEVIPQPFQAPTYDRLAPRSIDEWKRRADEAWKHHRDRFVRDLRYWEAVGVDQKIQPPTKARGPAQNKQRANIPDRYEWAALRLCGFGWKEIIAPVGISAVTKAATRVLFSAGWPMKLNAIRAALKHTKGGTSKQ
jgi:hypothetical protein